MTKVPVLIVDDDQIDRYLLKRELESLASVDLAIHEAKNGADAVVFFEQYEENKRKFGDDFPPLKIFLDINMPLLDGFGFLEAFTELRTRHDLGATTVMMITTSGHQRDMLRSKAYDFVGGYLMKGDYSIQELEAAVTAA
ncbi:MAG: response regulator [Pseudomonadota bacterium]